MMDQFYVSSLYPSCDSHHKTVEQADSVYAIAIVKAKIHPCHISMETRGDFINKILKMLIWLASISL